MAVAVAPGGVILALLLVGGTDTVEISAKARTQKIPDAEFNSL